MQYGLDESGMEDERDGVSRVFSAQIREQCNIEEGKLYCTGTGWHWEHYRVQTVLQCDVEHTGWYEEQNKVWDRTGWHQPWYGGQWVLRGLSWSVAGDMEKTT